MVNEPYLLHEDRIAAEARIRELEILIQDLGEDFRDAFTQSSETWHDNSPFEAVRDKQSMYAAELDQLRTLIRTSTFVQPRKKRGTVGVGDTVGLDTGKLYKIAGDWTTHPGKHADGVWWVSRRAPLAQAMIGKRIGDKVIAGRVSATIQSIER